MLLFKYHEIYDNMKIHILSSPFDEILKFYHNENVIEIIPLYFRAKNAVEPGKTISLNEEKRNSKISEAGTATFLCPMC